MSEATFPDYSLSIRKRSPGAVNNHDHRTPSPSEPRSPGLRQTDTLAPELVQDGVDAAVRYLEVSAASFAQGRAALEELAPAEAGAPMPEWVQWMLIVFGLAVGVAPLASWVARPPRALGAGAAVVAAVAVPVAECGGWWCRWEVAGVVLVRAVPVTATATPPPTAPVAS
jgi:hypothetical protein